MVEEEFYTPIKNYFERIISNDLGFNIKMIETHSSIPKKVRESYPAIYSVSNLYTYNPDLIGIISAGKNREKLLIVEVKDDPLGLSDLYQIKRYSEIIKADYSFLLSPFSFKKEDEQLMKTDEMSHIKNYYLKLGNKIFAKKIIVGKISYKRKRGKIIISNISFDSNFDLL